MKAVHTLALPSDQERSLFLWLAFVFQGFFSEYIFFLLRSGAYFSFFFFLEHRVMLYNFWCLLFFYDHSLFYQKRILVKMTWRRTKVGWGKKVPIERLERRRLFFFGLRQSFNILEIQGYGGLQFTFFNTDFFFKPRQRRVFFLVHSFWWYGLSFFLYAKSYLHHLTMVRYNHYVEAVFGGAQKPLLRAAVTVKYRRGDRPWPKDFKYIVQEKFAIFLAQGRFIFFKDRVKKESTTAFKTFKTKYYITEALEADAHIVTPDRRWKRMPLGLGAEDAESTLAEEGAEDVESILAEEDAGDDSEFYPSLFFSFHLWNNHKSLKALSALHLRYLHSTPFGKYSFYYYFYFVHRYIQKSPKKYGFTYSWVNCWLSLPFIGSLWDEVSEEFMWHFVQDLMSRYLFFLLGSDGFFDINLVDAWWAPWEGAKNFFDYWRSFHYDVRFLDYNQEERLSQGPLAFGHYWHNWEMAFDHLKGLAVFFHASALLRFLMERLFRFAEASDVLPFSYPIFTFWKITHFYIFAVLARKEEPLLAFLQRLHLDAFFFARLRHFLVSFDNLLYTIRLATREDFLEHLGILEAESPVRPQVVSPGGDARLKLHMHFFFFLRDFFFKSVLRSRSMLLYLFFFSLGSLRGRRNFFLEFGGAQFLQFRAYFAGLFLDRFAAPAAPTATRAEEPIVFFDPGQHGLLRDYHWQFWGGNPQRAVMARGKVRGFHRTTKWHNLIPAFSAQDVSVWYMEEPPMDASNWEYSLAGLAIPEPRFLEGYKLAEHEAVLELRLSFFFMVYGR